MSSFLYSHKAQGFLLHLSLELCTFYPSLHKFCLYLIKCTMSISLNTQGFLGKFYGMPKRIILFLFVLLFTVYPLNYQYLQLLVRHSTVQRSEIVESAVPMGWWIHLWVLVMLYAFWKMDLWNALLIRPCLYVMLINGRFFFSLRTCLTALTVLIETTSCWEVSCRFVPFIIRRSYISCGTSMETSNSKRPHTSKTCVNYSSGCVIDLTTQATWLTSDCWIQTHVLSGVEPLQSSLTHCAHACNSHSWSLLTYDGQRSGMFSVAFTISTLIRGRCRHEALTWSSSLHTSGTVAFLDWGSSSPRCSFLFLIAWQKGLLESNPSQGLLLERNDSPLFCWMKRWFVEIVLPPFILAAFFLFKASLFLFFFKSVPLLVAFIMDESTNKAFPECSWNRRDCSSQHLIFFVFKWCIINIYWVIFQMYYTT